MVSYIYRKIGGIVMETGTIILIVVGVVVLLIILFIANTYKVLVQFKN
jgi:hypothetical protein